MKTIIYSLLLSLITVQAFAQCNIHTSLLPTTFLVNANYEDFYRKEEPNNLTVVMGGLTILVTRGRPDSTLRVLYIRSFAADGLVRPRLIDIHFSDGTEPIYLFARTMINVGDAASDLAQESHFFLSADDFQKLMEHNISIIKISDNRTNQSLDMRPYPQILREQASCVFSTSSHYK